MKSGGDMKVLVAVADAEVRNSLMDALGGAYETKSVESAAHIIELLEDGRFDAVFLGSGLSGISVSELLEILVDKDLPVKIAYISKTGDEQTRADILEAGADAALVHPFDPREAVAMAQKFEEILSFRNTIEDYRERELRKFVGLMGTADEELQSAIGKAMKLAGGDGPVLICGEMGSGKGLLARAIVLAGPRPLENFEAYVAREKPGQQVDQDLFGAGDNRGIIERASGGSVLIHGVGELPMRLQEKLYRSIDFHWGRTRFIFTSRIDLHGAAHRGEFDEKLLKMVQDSTIEIPPLRERKVAIENIANEMTRRYAERMGAPVSSIHPSAMAIIKSYPWPGNLEELEKTIALAVSRSGSSMLLPDDLPIASHREGGAALDGMSLEEVIAAKLAPLVDTLDDLPEGELYKLALSKLERPLLRLVLEKVGSNKVRAAKALGLHRNTLRKKLKELKMPSKFPPNK